jgi:carboxylesterase
LEALPTFSIYPGAESYLLRGSRNTGVLLVHGFCGTPDEVRPLAELFHALNYTVYAIRLTGHGTHPRELHGTHWTHWVNDIENGLTVLSALCEETIVCGFSMGGTLSVQAAAKHPDLKALITLDAPVRRNTTWIAPFFTPLSWLVPVFSPVPLAMLTLSKERKVVLERLIAHNNGYTSFSTRSFGEFFRLIRYVNRLVSRVHQPALVIHSRKDDVVDFKNGEYLLDMVSAKHRTYLWLNESLHNVLQEPEIEKIKQAITAFLEQFD